ncbi:hypothetical protein JCM10213_000793 [Rhodosporidiobolus nylandii]
MLSLPAIPSVPRNFVDPDDMHAFLPWSIEHALIPFFPFFPGEIGDVCPDAELEALPPWLSELEAWYRLFHADTWIALGDDDYEDTWFLYDIIALEDEHKHEALAAGAEGERWLMVFSERCALVEARRLIRWLRLYALHGIRELYLEGKRGEDATRDDEVLGQLPKVENEEKPLGTPGSGAFSLFLPLSH